MGKCKGDNRGYGFSRVCWCENLRIGDLIPSFNDIHFSEERSERDLKINE